MAALVRGAVNGRLLALGLAVLLVTGFSLRSNADSDPRYTLLVAQSLIENGTIRLDRYRNDRILGAPWDEHLERHGLLEINGHFYSYFPAGPSVLSVPIVALANSLGFDMRIGEDNYSLQQWLGALSSMVVLWIAYFIARTYLAELASLVIAGVIALGSTLASTLGTALWSINFSTLFIALSLLFLVRYDSGRMPTTRPALLGVLLFLAYFSRAAAAAFILPTLVYLLVKDRRQFLVTASIALSLLLLFVGWSRLELGSWLPIYYSAARLQVERVPLIIGAYGLLLSPSRGLFVFSPFFILLIPGLLILGRQLGRQMLVWLCFVWIALQLFFAARATSWWGGQSFGPRILTELVLALLLLTVLTWREVQIRLSPNWQKVTAVAFLIFGIAGIMINSFQGLYNLNAYRWNNFIEAVPSPPFNGLGDLFNWRRAQFLASDRLLCTIQAERMQTLMQYETTLGDYQWGAPIPFSGDANVSLRATARQEAMDEATGTVADVAGSAPRVEGFNLLAALLPIVQYSESQNTGLFIGWDRVREGVPFRWSICENAHIIFRLGDVVTAGDDFVLVLDAGAHGTQEVVLSLNGSRLGAWTFSDQAGPPQTATFQFDGRLLEPKALNDLELHMPNARLNSLADQKRLGIALSQLAIHHADDYPPRRVPDHLPPAAYP